MRPLLVAIILAFLTAPAAAQDYNIYEPLVPAMPKTVPFVDGKGNIIGSAAISGNRIYVRGLDSQPIATIVVDRDGTKTIYDANGKILDQLAGTAKE